MKFIKMWSLTCFRPQFLSLSRKYFSMLLLIPLFLCSNTVVAEQEFESTQKIRQAAKIFLEEMQTSADKVSTEVTVGHIDTRLRLAKCAAEPEYFLPQTTKQTGKTTVGIRCNGPIAWKIFVAAQVTNYQNAWVVNRNLVPGEVLTEEDIRQQRVAVTDRRKIPMVELKQLLNTSPRRRMRAGSTIYHDSICLVCKGDTVTVAAVSPYLSINVEAIALSNAVLGEKVQVQNSNSRKVFDAIVTGKDQLNVNLTGPN